MEAPLPDFHDLSRETLLVIASPDRLLLPMALIERERRTCGQTSTAWGPTLILEIATDRRTRTMEGEQKIELTIRSFILQFKITSDPPMDRPSELA